MARIAPWILSALLALLCLYKQSELERSESRNMEKIVSILKSYESYTVERQQYLDEPGTQDRPALERVRMLRDHAEYMPSPKWIRGVADAVEDELSHGGVDHAGIQEY